MMVMSLKGFYVREGTGLSELSGGGSQDMRRDGQVGRWQASAAVMQAAFLPGQPLVLAAAGGDGAMHLMDLNSPLGALRLTFLSTL